MQLQGGNEGVHMATVIDNTGTGNNFKKLDFLH